VKLLFIWQTKNNLFCLLTVRLNRNYFKLITSQPFKEDIVIDSIFFIPQVPAENKDSTSF